MTDSPPAIDVKNLNLRLGGRQILSEVSIRVEPGEIVSLYGASGSGKSSLLRCLNRLNEPPKGTVELFGQDITSLNVIALRRKVGMMFQTPALFPGTVEQNISYSHSLQNIALDETRLHQLLDAANLPEDFAQRSVQELSGGEAQRVSLARALACQPEVLLLDEPTSALDSVAREQIWRTIAKLREETRLSVLWVSHDLEEVRRTAQRAYQLDNGRVVRHAPVAELFSKRLTPSESKERHSK